jgi:integrase
VALSRWAECHAVLGSVATEALVAALSALRLNGRIVAGLRSGRPLFQSVNSAGTEVTGRALNRHKAWATIRKRAKAAGFLTPVGCHTWRATGITIYLENDGRLEHAQQMAGHESPRTTKLYDRTKEEITLSEVERIRL